MKCTYVVRIKGVALQNELKEVGWSFDEGFQGKLQYNIVNSYPWKKLNRNTVKKNQLLSCCLNTDMKLTIKSMLCLITTINSY